MLFRSIQDPKIQQMVGQSPQAQTIMSAAQAHIAEHIAFEYRKQVEDTLGSPLPPPDETLPPEAEVELSRLVSQAAQQLLAKNQNEQAQQQAQQNAQDPIVQMQQQELQLKQQEAMAKAMKMKADAELDIKKLELEKMKIESQERIAGANMGYKAQMDKQKLEMDATLSGAKFGAEQVHKHREHKFKEAQQHLDTLNNVAGHAQQIASRQHDANLSQLQHANQLDMQKETKPTQGE